MQGVPRTYDDHLLIIGDAAGHIDPLTGEGIHTAMMARPFLRLTGVCLAQRGSKNSVQFHSQALPTTKTVVSGMLARDRC